MEDAWDEEETQEWWFTRDGAGGAVHGPFTPEEIDMRYHAGTVSQRSLVRWLPVAYSKPSKEEQAGFDFAPLSMLCDDGSEPPFSNATVQRCATRARLRIRSLLLCRASHRGRACRQSTRLTRLPCC